MVIAFWCIVLGAALAFASPRHLHGGQFALPALSALLIVAYIFVLHEQLSEHPWLASPNPIWRETSELLGVPLHPSASIARNDPYFKVGAQLAPVLAFLCGAIVCADRTRAQQLLKVVAWSGAAYAIFGIGSFLVDPTKIFWRDKQLYLDVLTATFLGRNTAADYFGSVAVVWLVLISVSLRREWPGEFRWSQVASRIFTAASRDLVIAFAMFLICLTAMFMTGSRAGVVISLLALVVAFVSYFWRDLPRRTGILSAIGGGVVVALILLQVLGAGVSGRFTAQGLADEGRMEAYRATLRMIADHPWFGTGLGTFVWAYPEYRSANVSVWGVWDRAHNTPLELAAEVGIPLAVLVCTAWIIVLIRLFRGVQLRRRDLEVPVIAFSVAVLAVIHSLIDFSLQIPGYSIVVFALLGAGISQSFSSIVTSPSQNLAPVSPH